MNEQIEQNEQNISYDRLKTIQQKAIELRLRGFRYGMISHALNKAGYKVMEHTIRVWFMKGGKCYFAYTSLVSRRTQEFESELQEVDYQLRAGAVDAVAILREALVTGNVSKEQLRAAQDILDRAGFPRKTTVDSNATLEISRQEKLDELRDNIRKILDKQAEKLKHENNNAQYINQQAIPTNQVMNK